MSVDFSAHHCVEQVVPVGVHAAPRLSAVAHDGAALRNRIAGVARVETVTVRVERPRGMSEFMRRNRHVEVVRAGLGRVREETVRVANHTVREIAQLADKRLTAKGVVAPAGEELHCVALNGALVGLPVSVKLGERVSAVV